MALPPLPRETGQAEFDIHALFVYLQRAKDQFRDTVETVAVESTYSDENAQDAVGNIFQDTASVNFNYDDVTPRITADVEEDSSVQKVEIAQDDIVIGRRKRLNFSGPLSIIDNTPLNQVDITFSSVTGRRIVNSDETVTIEDIHCLIVTRYFRVEGLLILKGDATLEVL